MSSESPSASLISSTRTIVALSVIIGFTILVAGGVAFIIGLNFLGEALVLAGVFLFAFTLLCYLAARRTQNR